jgi:acyl carrier protein
MTVTTVSHDQIMRLISEFAHIEAPSVETDLIESCLLDSLLFMELLSGLEERFGLRVNFDDIEFDNFRSVGNIAEFVNRRRRSLPTPQSISTPNGIRTVTMPNT